MKTEAEKKVVIDSERCKGCELCVGVCPVEIIRMVEEINVHGYHFAEVNKQSKCISCGRCATICPDMAIEVYKVEDKE